MHKLIPIVLLAITASVLLTGQAALASKTTFNITVNCNNGTQAHKQAQSSSNNVNVNVNCASSGGTPGPQGPAGPQGLKGDTGAAGKNGQNATVTIVTTANMTGFNTKHSSCNSPAIGVPMTCKSK